jgi:hypothetical protein
MMRAPTTGLTGGSLPASPLPLRASATTEDGTYWAPGLARLPVRSHKSFSR